MIGHISVIDKLRTCLYIKSFRIHRCSRGYNQNLIEKIIDTDKTYNNILDKVWKLSELRNICDLELSPSYISIDITDLYHYRILGTDSDLIYEESRFYPIMIKDTYSTGESYKFCQDIVITQIEKLKSVISDLILYYLEQTNYIGALEYSIFYIDNFYEGVNN